MLVGWNGWLAAVPPCVGFAGWLFGGMDGKPLCVPRMGIEEDQSAAIGTKIAKSWKTFYSWEMKVLLTLK